MNQLIKKGFTLIELIIVISVIGILLVVAYPSYQTYVGTSRATRLNTYAGAMMSGARLANGIHVAKGLSSTDLLVANDGFAVNGWPSTAYVCNVVQQQMDSGPDTGLTSTSTPVSCNNGVLQDVTAATPSACQATYHQATTTDSAYVDTSGITNCK
jgi:prepilin-type N-terminal cleavage/methylation domain-containing protein